MPKQPEYDASAIEVLEGLDPVRKRRATPPSSAWRVEDTWVGREELAYNACELRRSARRGLVEFAGKLVLVRLGVPDTFFTIPAVLDEDVWTFELDLAKHPKGHHQWLREQYLRPKGTGGYVALEDVENKKKFSFTPELPR
jgi:hypothetical protein